MNINRHTIHHLYWLHSMGIECYYSDQPKPKLSQQNKSSKVELLPVESLHDGASNIVQANFTESVATTRLKDQSVPIEHKQQTPTQLARKLADTATDLEHLKQLVLNFNGCQLKEFATNTVFADGNPSASIMLIGEAPGSNEDKFGIPFCGESGKLLDAMLKSINISRKTNAYITNTIFWRPPANRTPTQEEIEICKPFVEKHIALVAPKLIVMVGNTAATSLLGTNIGISKIRQEYYSYTNQYLNAPILSTAIFHPAYLLRQPMQKKTTWYDLIKIKRFIDGKMIENNM